MPRSKRIVVTGIGPLTSIGTGVDALWKSLLEKKTNIKTEKAVLSGELWQSFKYHKIDNFNIADFNLDKDVLSWIKDWKEGDEITDLFFMLASIKLALDDSKIDYNLEDNEIGLVVSHENISLVPFFEKIMKTAYSILGGTGKKVSQKEFYEQVYKTCYKSGYDVQPFMTLFHAAKVFNIHRHSLFVCNACASGLYAIETASEIIRNEHSPIMVVAASDHADVIKYLWFKDIGIYSKQGLIRPFSKDSDGFIFGDAGIALVLEDYEHAKKRKAKIYAEYLGGGFSLESWQVTMPQVGSNFYQKAIEGALEKSGTKNSEIDLVCPHGVGSHVTDFYESKAINDVFGKGKNVPSVSAFKPYVGHTLGASALLETAILVMCLKNQIILPTLNCDNVNPQYKIKPVNEITKTKLNNVMKTSAAFAGYNAAAVFAKVN